MAAKEKPDEQTRQERGRQVRRDRGSALSAEEWTAESEECGGALRVLTFGYLCSDGQGEFNPEYQRLAGVEITVSGEDFSGCETTNENGEVFWTGLSPGSYTITASPLPGYHSPHYYPANSITVSTTQEAEVGIGFPPEPAEVNGFVYTEVAGQQQRINGVPVDFYQGEKLFDCFVTCKMEGQEGYFKQPVKCPGLITVVPRQTITVQGRTFHSVYNTGIVVQADPGQMCYVEIPYIAGLAEIVVSACLIRQKDHKEEKLPLPSTTFRLYQGSTASGVPIREVTTQGMIRASFCDVGEGDYTITASGLGGYQGQAIELVRPPGGELHVNVGAGQTLRLIDQFCFKPCVGRVSGMVLDATCGVGVEGVQLLLSRDDGESFPQYAVTESNGVFLFDNVAPGAYLVRLAQEKIALLDGTKWTLSSAGAIEYKIKVGPSAATQVPAFQLKPDESRIIGKIVDADGNPVPFTEVIIYDALGIQELASLIAGEDGTFTWIAPAAGRYYTAARLTTGGEPLQKYQADVHSDAYVTIVVPRGNPHPLPPPPPTGGLHTAIADISAYPVLTEPISIPTAPAASGFAVPGAAPLGQVVEGALREILAWRPKASDPKGFVAALTQAFTCKEVEGRTECTWTPRSYAVQADMGAVTGAQASIYTRAKVALDQSLPLLDGLKPLRSDADEEDTEANRAIIRAELTELVNELGVEGGPRVQRVDTLFALLIGESPNLDDPGKVEGQLAVLRDEFGLRRNRVNTIEEEQNLTNFFILVDYVNSLKKSWDSQRGYFDRIGADVFLGTQLVLLSRTLAVVAESVHEVYLAMDSVFIGSAERQTLRLDFPGGKSPLFVAELLAWAERFASEEGPRLVQEGGKAGVRAFFPPLDELRKLVRAALIRSQGGAQDPENLSAGYSTARVQRALRELADQLDEAARLARPFKKA